MMRSILILALIPPLVTFAALDAGQFRINASESLPIGLYRVSPTGAFVEFCPDDHGLSAQRHYRPRGGCADGAAPLLKPLVAGPGNEIVLNSAGISVNGKLLRNTAPLGRDTEGRPLPHSPYGSYTTPAGMQWVASTYNSRSYDSRYFGPIRESAVRARLQPVIAW
ncbi:MAG: conjugative transfer signal peptidase TraF [Acidobacteriia bacterium]|nr:conjugative transfer signal peptidase TraF [Terriglobia bacterium]